MANNDFSDPCQRADSQNRISFLADFRVWVTFEARGSVSVGFWGSCQLSPFWGTGGLARGFSNFSKQPLPGKQIGPHQRHHCGRLRKAVQNVGWTLSIWTNNFLWSWWDTTPVKMYQRCVADRAYPDGYRYHYWKSEGNVLSNATDRPACTTVMNRGVAMNPLRRWGRTEDWRMQKKKKAKTIPVKMYQSVFLCPRKAGR